MSARVLAAAALCLCCSWPALGAGVRGPAQPGREAQKTLTGAVALYRKADFAQALQQFNKALALFEGWKTASGYRAMCRWNMGDKAGAEQDAALAAQLKPNSAESFVSRGQARFVLKDYAGAAEDFDSALRLDPDAAEAHFGLGSVASAQGDLGKALKSLGQAVRINSEFATAILVRGTVYERRKDFARAISDFDRVLEINPKFIWAHFYRGKSLREVKEYRRSLADFDDFIETHGDFAEAFYLRSNVRFLMGDYSGAESDLSRVIELDPKRGLAYSNRGQARALLGDRAGALSDLRKALELEPSKRDKIQTAIERIESGAVGPGSAPAEDPGGARRGAAPPLLGSDGDFVDTEPAAPETRPAPGKGGAAPQRQGGAFGSPYGDEEYAPHRQAAAGVQPARPEDGQAAGSAPTVTIEDRGGRTRADSRAPVVDTLPEPPERSAGLGRLEESRPEPAQEAQQARPAPKTQPLPDEDLPQPVKRGKGRSAPQTSPDQDSPLERNSGRDEAVLIE